MDSGFGVGVALHADSLARAFAGAGIGRSALASDRQAAQVTDATVALDALETFEVQAQLPAQVAFDDVFAILDGMDNLRELLFIQILGSNAPLDFSFFQNNESVRRTNAVDVA